MKIVIEHEKSNNTAGFTIKLTLSEENINRVPSKDKENFCRQLDDICRSFANNHSLTLV